MPSSSTSTRAGWMWLLPRILYRLRPRKKRPFKPDRKIRSAKEIGGNYFEVRAPAVRRFEPLPIAPANAAWLWSKPEEFSVAPWYRLELPSARVWGLQGWIGNEQGELLGDAFTEPTLDDWRIRACNAIREAETARWEKRQLAGVSATLLMPNHTNYFHWLWQGLPRFELLRPIADQVDHWIVPVEDRPYIRESLKALGIEPRKLVFAGAGTIHCERLWVPSQPATASYTAPEEFPAKFIRGLFVSNTSTQRLRIFVVRGSVAARQLLNEKAIAEHLAPHGFKRMSMDGLTIAQQAALFSGAEAVVAVHGAALANLIFCRAGTKIIELLPRNWPSPLYARLARDSKLDYRCLAGCEPALSWAPIRNLSADLRIDLKQLDAVLADAQLRTA